MMTKWQNNLSHCCKCMALLFCRCVQLLLLPNDGAFYQETDPCLCFQPAASVRWLQLYRGSPWSRACATPGPAGICLGTLICASNRSVRSMSDLCLFDSPDPTWTERNPGTGPQESGTNKLTARAFLTL